MNWVKGIKIELEANKILNQTLNIHIKNYLVEGSCKNMKF